MTSAASVTTLPALNTEEQAHSDRVSAHIRAFIAERGGVIGFDAFMRLALYAPGLGYYSAGATKFGGAGDFVTAPEVSNLFSRCLARQAADVLRNTGGDILELGAGSGRMARAGVDRGRILVHRIHVVCQSGDHARSLPQ